MFDRQIQLTQFSVFRCKLSDLYPPGFLLFFHQCRGQQSIHMLLVSTWWDFFPLGFLAPFRHHGSCSHQWTPIGLFVHVQITKFECYSCDIHITYLCLFHVRPERCVKCNLHSCYQSWTGRGSVLTVKIKKTNLSIVVSYPQSYSNSYSTVSIWKIDSKWYSLIKYMITWNETNERKS